ncbi:MAG: M28 family peptidase [Muribaculaceae bacterium]|nr:M28 family peptidase [Muribaculaceae bacterium]MDE6704067.1 M28 family peptidase [Muribaculaceae bacterium]
MIRLTTITSAALIFATALCSCNGTAKSTDKQSKMTEKVVLLGAFDKDSAYQYIADQVAFGPRVPGTPAHDACGKYIVEKLRQFGADTIIEQHAVVEAFNGDKLPINNIFAQYNPTALNRVLLVAHWDTRPWANMERSEERRMKPVPGANDGGSGVGVILEIARNLQKLAPTCGVDILFTDAEDYGNSNGFTNNDESWCLGTQYWVDNMPYTSVNRPANGILLDMVGGTDARFHRERYSNIHAKPITVKIWGEAKNLGYEDIFVNKVAGEVVDDHTFLNQAGIPTTDIIEHMSDATGSFPATWHTLDDDIQHISKKTLDAVGNTVLNVIYKEKAI